VRASDLTISLPLVDRASKASDAVRIIAEQDLIGLVVADASGVPKAVVSAIDVARLMLPRYIRDDLSLANVVGESGVRDLWGELADRTIGDVLDDDEVQARAILTVEPDATLVEVAARLVDARTQVCRVVGDDGVDHGFVTLPHLLDAIVATVDERGTAE
jgi:CBS domain-containing protein